MKADLMSGNGGLIFALGRKKRSGTPWRTTPTGERALDCRRVTPLVDQGVVITKLFASGDIPQGIDNDAAVVVFHGFAVRFTRMIDIPGVISAPAAIDDAAIRQ
ncbi:hypothetical protein ASE07_26050 [Noviherbaspirillum sp. Root189]|nr:hypothetical protein ASE07_26050 [Noviherbaspirillum sp. Root189]